MGDGGYQHGFIIAPKDVPASRTSTHKFLRGVVEIVFAFVHTFAAATVRFRESVGFQVLCLLVVYELVARRLEDSPVRARFLTSLSCALDPTPVVSAEERHQFESFVDDILNSSKK